MTDITHTECEILLQLARQSIGAAVEGTSSPCPPSSNPRLMVPQGAFVTIRCDDALRGCIGRIPPIRPLAETIIEMAAAAATQDTRFSPMTRDELDTMTVGVSVLSVPYEVDSIGQIVLGTHGLIVSGRHHRGVLLPFVPIEQGWDLERFVEATCQKAGLPSSAWRDDDVVLEAFTAQVF
jgi:AmmeMemoRadiSam system protein A